MSIKMRVLNHSPWIGTFPLNPFHEKIYEKKSPEKEQNLPITPFLRIAFSTVLLSYTLTTRIIERIDNDMANFIEFRKIFQLVRSGVSVSYNEMPLDSAHLMNLDIHSLIIFLDILLDDTSRFLEYLFIESHFLNFGSFLQLKNSLKSYGGERVEELSEIFKRTDWYEELNKLRNKPVVHTGVKGGGVGTEGDQVGIYLRTRTKKNKISEAKFMSNVEIDRVCDNVHSFLNELNSFLCQNFESLPLKVRKK